MAVASAGPHASLHLTPASLSFYRPDALPAAHPTASKHVTFIKIINADANNKTRLLKIFGRRCRRLLHLW